MSPLAAAQGSPRDEVGLAVEVLEGRDAFNSLEREWNAAWAKGPRPDPMLRHDWFRAFIENFAPVAPLRVFVARAAGEIHAAMPLIEQRGRSADTCFVPMTTWSLPANDHSQRGGVLLGRRGPEALELIWERLLATRGWDRLRLRDLPEGAAEWRLRELAAAAGHPCGLWISLRSPYLPIPAAPEVGAAAGKKGKVASLPAAVAGAAFAAIEAALDGKFRQNLRRRRRRLAEKGEVRYVVLDGRDAKALDVGLADFYEIESCGWKGKGGTAIALRPELVGFYTQIARDAAKRGTLVLGFLEVGARRIAGHLSIVESGRHYLVRVGYDESFHEYSPGQQIAAEAIRDACARGLHEFDFLGPCMDWKLDWEPGLRTHTWLTIFRPTPAGRFVHEVRYTVWPALRALLARLTPAVKKEG